MDLQSRKLELIQEFLKIKSEDVISRLEKILKKENSKSEKKVKPMTMDEFNSRVDQSMEDSKNGRLIESRELKAKIGKWN